MKIIYLIFFLWFLLDSCNIIKPKFILYNNKTELFEYKINNVNTLLRNYKMQVIDSSNINLFHQELQATNYKYNIEKRTEIDNLWYNDYEISKLYFICNQNIIDNEYHRALKNLNRLSKKYKKIIYYSDYYFLRAISYENIGFSDSAYMNYELFLKYSGQKYSTHFRGYRDADKNDSLYVIEKKYAKNYINNVSNNRLVFDTNYPKYYYSSFMPGYAFNSEDFARGTNYMWNYVLGFDYYNQSAIGGLMFLNLKKNINLFSQFLISENSVELIVSLPLQILKSKNNNFGLKLSPFSKIYFLSNFNFFNYGAKISIGYYPINNFMIGAYYDYNFYNEYNHFTTLFDDFWNENEYDVSIYYNLFKNTSLKIGVRNNYFIFGWKLSTWDFTFDITNLMIYLKTDLY